MDVVRYVDRFITASVDVTSLKANCSKREAPGNGFPSGRQKRVRGSESSYSFCLLEGEGIKHSNFILQGIILITLDSFISHVNSFGKEHSFQKILH
jgi:hypothetical protein